MGGEAEFGAFSQGTATVLALTVLLSVGAGIFSQRIFFPWLMENFFGSPIAESPNDDSKNFGNMLPTTI